MNGDPSARRPNLSNPFTRNLVAATALALVLPLASCGSGKAESASTPDVTVSDTQPSPTTEITPTTASETETPVPVGEFSTEPTWEQDFTTQTQLDTTVWRYEDDPAVPTWNEETQAYTSSPENVRVEPGTGLIIEAHRTPFAYPDGSSYDYTSGRIDTLGNFSFTNGKIEATMKLPAGSGTWPAFWLLSANGAFTGPMNPTDEQWGQDRFYLHDGELDVMEAYGDQPGLVEATVHSFNNDEEGQLQLPDAADVFHTYGVEVTPTAIKWTIDGEVQHVFEKPSDNPDDWPFQAPNELYPIFNLAMGAAGGTIDDAQAARWQLQVQKISFYDFNAQ
jgi:beta-glucanase (GH16 family)